MIKGFKHKGLKELFEKGRTAKVNTQHSAKCLRILDALDAALQPEEMIIPGFKFHGLNTKPKSYAVAVTGNWRVTFEWGGQDATHVELADYH